MPEAGEPVGCPLKGTCQIKNGQRRLQVEFTLHNHGRDLALRRVRVVLSVDKPADRRECIFGIGSLPFRHVSGCGNPSCGSLCAFNDRGAKSGQLAPATPVRPRSG